VKQSIFALTTLLTTALISSSVAYADQKSDVQEIRNSYQAFDEAAVVNTNYDVDRAFAIYAPNFTQTGIDGKVYSAAYVRQRVQNYHNSTLGAYQTAVEQSNYRFKFMGQTAIVRYDQKQNFLQYLKDSTRVPTTVIGSYEDTWQRQGSGWKIVNIRTLQEKISQGLPERTPVYVDPEVENIIRQGNAVNNGWQFLRGVGVTP
jgi:Domain of unknown function (DUF4440)